jgi:hypothetical protein
MIYKGATGNVDMEVSEKWIEMKGLRDLPEDWRGQHLGIFFELKKNLYLWAKEMEDAKTGRIARDSRGDGFFNVMAIFTIDGDEILTLWERPSNLPVATHGGPGVGFQYESVVTENYEVIYSDGVSAMKKFRTEQQALDFMKQTIASNKKLRDIAVYKPGMHSTTQTELVVAFWGNGSYLDNVSKKDSKLAAKKIEEGNAFGAARAEAIAKGEKTFKVGSEEYDVENVDQEDKENAKEFVGEAWVGPFQFTDKMSDDELKNMYDEAVSGYANWQKGFEYPKSDYKKAYQEIEKILKKRGVVVESAEIEEIDEARSINKIQKEWAEVTSMMKSTVEEWKKAEGDSKTSLLDKLKSLTARKNELEKELDSAVQLKDVDAELVEAKKPSWDALIEEFKMTNEDLRTDLKKYIKANEKELNELADNDNWESIYDMLRNDFNVKEGSKEDEDLISTFNFIF